LERAVDAGHVSDGVGNIELGARHPFYQFVSDNDFFDTTLGGAIELGIPVHSTVSKNTELVPKIFNDLRLGNHFTMQTILGHSTLFRRRKGRRGHRWWNTAFDFGYSIPHQQLRIPHVQQLVPLFELSGRN